LTDLKHFFRRLRQDNRNNMQVVNELYLITDTKKEDNLPDFSDNENEDSDKVSFSKFPRIAFQDF